MRGQVEVGIEDKWVYMKRIEDEKIFVGVRNKIEELDVEVRIEDEKFVEENDEMYRGSERS